jgi:hypothetical protein
MELGYNPAFNKSCQALGFFFGSLLGCKFYEGREVVFNAWRLEETKPLKQRQTLAVRSRIYIYSKLEK